jgi:hypothetical protein
MKVQLMVCSKSSRYSLELFKHFIVGKLVVFKFSSPESIPQRDLLFDTLIIQIHKINKFIVPY